MKKNNNYKKLWDMTSQSDKERIFNSFLREYGENYTPDDLATFLKKRYRVPDQTPAFSNWRRGF